MPVYRFTNLPAYEAVSVADVEGNEAATGTTDNDGVFEATLDAGTYIATVGDNQTAGEAVPQDGDVPVYSGEVQGYAPGAGGVGYEEETAYKFFTASRESDGVEGLASKGVLVTADATEGVEWWTENYVNVYPNGIELHRDDAGGAGGFNLAAGLLGLTPRDSPTLADGESRGSAVDFWLLRGNGSPYPDTVLAKIRSRGLELSESLNSNPNVHKAELFSEVPVTATGYLGVAGQRFLGRIALPTTTQHQVGDTLLNPADDGLYMCTAGGAPGTWHPVGLIAQSPNGSRFRITVGNDGTLGTTAL